MKNSYKALILEDNEIDASLLEKYLNKSGETFIVEWVIRGEDYEKKVLSFKPDVIITDYRLKDYSGDDALKFRNKYCEKIPFVIVSGNIGEEKAAKLIKKGASDFLMKSNAESSLAVTVLRVLNEFHEKEINRILKDEASKNQLLLETITNHAELPVWIREPDGKFYFVNKQFRNIFNLDDDVQIVGKKIPDILDEETAAQFGENDKRVIEGNKPILFEEKVQTPEGVRYYQTNLFPLTELPDIEFAVGGLAIDITQQKESEFDLQKALEEKVIILESIGEAFFSVDGDWNILYWNKNAENIFGVDREQVAGENVWSVIPNAAKLKKRTSDVDIRKKQKPIFFEEFYPAVGKWLDVSVYPMENSISVFFRDITVHKKSLEEIRQTYERFEKVTEATNDAIWDWDIENDTLLWGGGFKALFGYEVDRVTQSLDSWTDHIDKDDQIRVLSSLHATVEDPDQSSWQSEYKYIRKDGSYAYVIDRAVIIRDDSGKALRVIGAMTDITYHHEYEKNLQNMNEMLQKYTRDLEVSNTELEQFAYMTSHDLQEPLRMITSFMELLKTKYGEKLDDKAHQYIHYAIDGAVRMREVILDLLEYSRAGKSEEDKELLDVNEIVKFVCQMQHKKIKKKNANIEMSELPEILSYRAPLIQIFQNLIGNALKYSKKDQVPKIHISSIEEDEEWVFLVKDNGIGIHPDYFEKIFIIFQRLHSNDEYDGSGIGLSIVKKIIENMNGRIWVESKEGEGSTFFFAIPKSG